MCPKVKKVFVCMYMTIKQKNRNLNEIIEMASKVVVCTIFMCICTYKNNGT